MKLKVFTLQLDDSTGAFDDSALQTLLSDWDALAVDQHFFVHDGAPRWALLVHCRETSATRRDHAPASGKSDWRADLSNDEADLFSALRSWRNSRARRDRRPAFVLFTNRQLAEIARVAPRTLTELATLHGVGEARVRDYGESVLAVVREAHGDSDSRDELGARIGDAASLAPDASEPPADQPAEEAG